MVAMKETLIRTNNILVDISSLWIKVHQKRLGVEDVFKKDFRQTPDRRSQNIFQFFMQDCHHGQDQQRYFSEFNFRQ